MARMSSNDRMQQSQLQALGELCIANTASAQAMEMPPTYATQQLWPPYAVLIAV